jgi:hypothetical protein
VIKKSKADHPIFFALFRLRLTNGAKKTDDLLLQGAEEMNKFFAICRLRLPKGAKTFIHFLPVGALRRGNIFSARPTGANQGESDAKSASASHEVRRTAPEHYLRLPSERRKNIFSFPANRRFAPRKNDSARPTGAMQ